MNQSVVTRMPLASLWNAAGPIQANRVRDLNLDDVRECFRHGDSRLVVADVGKPLYWVEHDDTFNFWSQEARGHIAPPEGFRLEDYPGEFCYVASQWHSEEEGEIILLEKHH